MTDRWLTEIADKGFTTCRGLVNGRLVQAAKDAVKEQLSTDLQHASDQDIVSWTNRTFVPEIESDHRLLDLYRLSPLAAMSAYAVAPYMLSPVERAQVQVRLSRKTPKSNAQPLKDWHCDGVQCPHLPVGRLNTFQLLVGILLTDLPHPSGGAVQFRVGGHRSVAEAFRLNQPFSSGVQVPPKVLGLPIEAMWGAAGDAIISHHMTPHAVGKNETDTDRIMVYFRLRVVDHENVAMLQLKEPWVRMPKLAAIAGG